MTSEKSFSVITENQDETNKPSRLEAEAAVRTLIRWAGDDPDREGLVDTPDRVVRSYEEFFAGYAADPKAILERTFEEVDGYDDRIIARYSAMHCEHHMVPIIGKATLHTCHIVA